MSRIADFRHGATAVVVAAAVALLPACGGDGGTGPAADAPPLAADGGWSIEVDNDKDDRIDFVVQAPAQEARARMSGL